MADQTPRFTFESELWLPQSPEQIFPFFADAGNLERITPPWLHFHVLSPQPIDMQVGTLIDYKLRLRGMPIRWRTEISAWEPPFRFVDRQIKGPYRCWIHEHRFIEQDGGTLCVDHVDYDMRCGRWLNKLVVQRDITRIFSFRRSQLKQQFTPIDEFTGE